jgi:hypothetical protein
MAAPFSLACEQSMGIQYFRTAAGLFSLLGILPDLPEAIQ